MRMPAHYIGQYTAGNTQELHRETDWALLLIHSAHSTVILVQDKTRNTTIHLFQIHIII